MDKKYSAKEAAFAVLKKAEEMLKSSELAKARVDEGKTPEQKVAARRGAPGSFSNRSHAHGSGMHTQYNMGDKATPGQSLAGGAIRMKDKDSVAHAKEEHKEKLTQLKALPKPNLTKSEAIAAQLAKGEGKHADNHTNNHDDTMASKGVNKVLPKHIPGKGVSHGSSSAGHANDMARAKGQPATVSKEIHKQTLHEIKTMSKPNLTKGEAIAAQISKFEKAEGHEKGVHVSRKTIGSEGKGMSAAGAYSRTAVKAKKLGLSAPANASGAIEEHKKVLKEIKEMPKPNLTKQEDSTMAMKEQDATPADGVQKDPAPSNTQPVARNGNPVWGTEPGSYKLAKFMGRREERKKSKSQEQAPAAIPNKEVK